MNYMTDKNGRSLKYVLGYRIRDDKGEMFEMMGTGLDLGRGVPLWTRDQKLVYRNQDEIEVVGFEFDPLPILLLLAGGVFLLLLLAGIGSTVGTVAH